MVMIESDWWSPFLFDGCQYFSHLEAQMNTSVTESPCLEEVPLGVLLSEEMLKSESVSCEPTSCYWTGGPDTSCPDEDQ